MQVLTDKGASFTYAKGYNVDGDKVDVKAQKEAVTLAEDADCVLFSAGLPTISKEKATTELIEHTQLSG